MREMVERDIDMLRNEQGEILCQAEDFKAKFYKFIVDHYLRKFHCFFFTFDSVTSTNHHLCLLNTAQPEESQAHAHGSGDSGELASVEFWSTNSEEEDK